jgi:hypothetical protein
MTTAVDPYREFISSKSLRVAPRGLTDVPSLAGHLFQFQREAVAFGLRAGSWGCFFDTGLGKTACELEWARHAAEATNGRALILTPLAVARQIESEGRRWGYDVRVIREQSEAAAGVNVCNYDRLHLLEPEAFGAVALDEASILKNFSGAVSRSLVAAFGGHRFRMAASATPAPNDHTELAQYAAFLGIMTREEMLVRWFINDSNDTKAWRLKGHAVTPFFDWMASWSRMAEHPRDLGDDVRGYDLPPLEVFRHQADEPEASIDGGLFGAQELSATEVHHVKRQTIQARADVAASLVAAEPDEPWVIWADTDYEADALLAAIPGARDVRGSYSLERKESTLADFAEGRLRYLVGKPSVLGFGLNWQFCRRMVFAGRSFSYEAWYQAVRRCWRFGQASSVHVHLVVAEGEDAIGRVIDRKADDHITLKREMVAAMRRAAGLSSSRRVAYTPTHEGRWPAWIGYSA